MFLDAAARAAHHKQPRADAMGLGAIVSTPYDACPTRDVLRNDRFDDHR